MFLEDSDENLRMFEKRARNMQSLSRYSRGNQINKEWIDQYLNEAHSFDHQIAARAAQRIPRRTREEQTKNGFILTFKIHTTMAQINFGGVEEKVVTREEFPLEKAREVSLILSVECPVMLKRDSSCMKSFTIKESTLFSWTNTLPCIPFSCAMVG